MGTRAKKGPPGYCTVCSAHCQQLTLEHVPPQSCYPRNIRLDNYRYEDLLKQAQNNPLGRLSDLRRSGVTQGGMKLHATCDRCNNYVSGQWYAPAYAEWVFQLLHVNSGRTVKHIAVPFRIRPLNILKQIVYMFLVINPTFRDYRRQLESFVLYQHTTQIPGRMRFYAGWYMGFRAKHGGHTARANIFAGPHLTWISEIGMRPLALLMTVDQDRRQEGLLDITDWSHHFRYDQQVSLSLKLPNVDEIQHIPGDLRSDEAMHKDVLENLAKEAEEKARKARDRR